jgi:TRAP-type uncharacterized transport system substrate-binding protein
MGFFQRHLPVIVLIIAVLLIALGVYGFVQTQRELPARDLAILTDEQGSGYYQVAERYQAIFAARGLDLTVRTTTGAEETLQLLADGAAGIALVPGFLTAQVDPRTFSSLGALFDEPFWVFYNKDAFDGEPVRYLSQLQGKRIAVGLPGSGSQALALQLLGESGVTADNTTLLELPRQAETEQMLAGDLDAVLLLDAYQSETVQALLRAPAIGLANLAQADAYAARQHALKVVDLPEGIIDLAQNVPAEDARLLASAANLVIRRDLNPTLARSLITAAMLVHSGGDYLAPPYTYPNLTATGLPVPSDYVDYFNRLKNGDAPFTSTLSFWGAYSAERFIFFLLPLIILLGVLVLYFPAIWRFYMQGKLLPIYQELRRVEIELPQMDRAATDAAIERISELEENITQRVRVSAAYLPEVFHLRDHIRSVQADLLNHQARLEALSPDDAVAAPPARKTGRLRRRKG